MNSRSWMTWCMNAQWSWFFCPYTHFSIHYILTCAYSEYKYSITVFLFSFFAFLRCTQTFYLHGAVNQTAGLKGGGAKNSLLQTWVLENKATYFWFGFFSSEPTDGESEIFNPQSECSFGDRPECPELVSHKWCTTVQCKPNVDYYKLWSIIQSSSRGVQE